MATQHGKQLSLCVGGSRQKIKRSRRISKYKRNIINQMERHEMEWKQHAKMERK